VSQLYLRTKEQEKLSRITYTLKIIWSQYEKATGRKTVLVIALFDDLSNNFSFTDKVGFVGMLCFSINVESMK